MQCSRGYYLCNVQRSSSYCLRAIAGSGVHVQELECQSISPHNRKQVQFALDSLRRYSLIEDHVRSTGAGFRGGDVSDRCVGHTAPLCVIIKTTPVGHVVSTSRSTKVNYNRLEAIEQSFPVFTHKNFAANTKLTNAANYTTVRPGPWFLGKEERLEVGHIPNTAGCHSAGGNEKRAEFPGPGTIRFIVNTLYKAHKHALADWHDDKPEDFLFVQLTTKCALCNVHCKIKRVI